MKDRPKATPPTESGADVFALADAVRELVKAGGNTPAAEAAAFAVFRKLFGASGGRSKPGTKPETVAEAVGRYLDRQAGRNLAAGTVGWYRSQLARLVAKFGPVPLDRLDTGRVVADCNSNRKWGPDSRRNYLSSVEQCLRFAGRPVRLDKPPRGSAGAKAVIPEAVYRAAVALATGDLGPLLTVLWNTGARPSEIRLLTCEQVDWSAGVASLTQHKTAGKTGKKRLIVFPPAALAVLERQREKYHGRGLLFRTRNNTRFGRDGLTQRVWRLGKKLRHPGLTAYGCRHTFATDALAAGVPDTHVAALLGHSGTEMLHKHYSHLSGRTQLLKDAAARARPAG